MKSCAGLLFTLLVAAFFTLFPAPAQDAGQPLIPPSLELARQRAALPSPLDKLSANSIPKLERFDWQPKELVAVLGEHRGRQGNPAYSVAFSIDGKVVASGGGNGLIRFWDRTTMRQHHLLGAHSGAVRKIVFFADGKRMASCGDDATVRLWDISGKEPKSLEILKEGSTPLFGLAVTPDGKYLATGGADSAVRYWALNERGSKQIKAIFKHTGAVHGVAISPDGKTLASAGADETIRLWNLEGDKIFEGPVLLGHKKNVHCVAFSPSGITLASGGADGTLRLWKVAELDKARPTAILGGKYGTVLSIAFGPKGSTTLATGHSNHTVHLWTLGAQTREKASLDGHGGPIYDLAVSPKKATALASASYDWTVRLWDLTVPRPVQRTVLKGHWSHTYSVSFSPDGKSIVSGSEDRTLRLWDANGSEPKEKHVYKKEPIAVYTLAYSPDGKGVAYAGADTAARLWEPERHWVVRSFTGHPTYVSALAFSPDGKRIVTASKETLRTYNVATGQPELEYKGHTTYINAVAFSPDGKHILSGAGHYEYKNNQILVVNGKIVYKDCTTRYWDADSAKELFQLKGHEFPILSVACSSDARRIAYGSHDCFMRLVDLLGEKPGKTTKFDGKIGHTYWIQFAPDGSTMVTVGIDGKVILWDPASAKRLREWTFNELTYRAIYAADSRHLAVPVGTGVTYILRIKDKG
jgi:WD40 repeat protein